MNSERHPWMIQITMSGVSPLDGITRELIWWLSQGNIEELCKVQHGLVDVIAEPEGVRFWAGKLAGNVEGDEVFTNNVI